VLDRVVYATAVLPSGLRVFLSSNGWPD